MRPIAALRHDEILRRIASAGTVSVEEIASVFGVSRETIRRDLKALAERGRLDIVHGGAVRRVDETALAVRRGENPDGKAAVGRAAAALIEDGMVVLLDSGATTLALADALGRRETLPSGLTVCTNAIAIAQMMVRVPGTRVHLLGGEIDPTDEAAFGVEVIEALARFRIDLAFVGAAGLSQTGDVTDFTRIAAEQRSRMLAVAAKPYIVADHSKFGRLTPIRIAIPAGGATLVVDEAPPRPIAEAWASRGLEAIVAPSM